MKVSIVGITGYSGLELVKILNNHKKVELVSIHATKEVGRRLKLSFMHSFLNKYVTSLLYFYSFVKEKLKLI